MLSLSLLLRFIDLPAATLNYFIIENLVSKIDSEKNSVYSHETRIVTCLNCGIMTIKISSTLLTTNITIK